MVGGGAYMLVKTRRFVATAIRTRGKVVAYETVTTDDDSLTDQNTYYHPIIEFKDAGGAQRRVTSTTGRCPKPYPEGTTVTVFFDPGNPEQIEIGSIDRPWLLPIALLGMGAIFLVGVICTWVFNIPVQWTVVW